MRTAKRKTSLLLALTLALFAASFSACSSATNNTPQPDGPTPTQITETLTATSTDGVLFDIKLSGTIYDHDGDISYRDEIEFLAPESIEFQGHFSDPTGDLVIASCFAKECQTAARTAEFTVRYWALAE